VNRGRVRLADDPSLWTRALFEQERVEPASTTPEAAVAAAGLPETFPGDPIDRLLYATAADLRLPLITRDRAIHRLAAQRRDIRTIW